MQRIIPNEELLSRTIQILKKSKTNWKNEKELSKVVNKIEKKKKLKRKEFMKVYEIIEKKAPYRK
jgi:hypothetical protein